MLELKNFDIIRDIGEGKFFKVFLVQDKQTSQQLSAKISKQNYSSQNEQNLFISKIKNYFNTNYPTILMDITFIIFIPSHAQQL